jgi:tetratricopeptide (TPR) repeat protein
LRDSKKDENNDFNNENEKKKNRRKRTTLDEGPLGINLVKITDDIIKGDPSAQEELKKQIKELKAKIKQEFGNGQINIELDGITTTLAQITEIFKGKEWLKDVEKKIKLTIPTLVELQESVGILEKTIPVKKIHDFEEKAVETAKTAIKAQEATLKANDVHVKELDENAKQIKRILVALKDYGSDARQKESYDVAIEILKDTDAKLLPLIKDQGVLPESDQKLIKLSILQELETALLQKGQINEAIRVIDSQCEDPDCTDYDYIKAYIKKSGLYSKKGEFNKAIAVLHKALDEFNLFPSKRKKFDVLAEIKRSLGMAYRSKGDFDEALIWFNEAKDEYNKIEDEIGKYNVLWGMGILYYLRGEWGEAIVIWKKIEDFYRGLKVSKNKMRSKYLFKLYFDYTRTLQLSGNFKEAQVMLNKSLSILEGKKGMTSTYARAKVYLAFAELFYLQNKIEEAFEAIQEVRKINNDLLSHEKETLPELEILEIEIRILCAHNSSEEAREKLFNQFESCKSNWDQMKYYRLLSLVEKHEMNYGQAKKALKSSLEIAKKIGVCPISDRLLYTELLIEMSRIGNKMAYNEAKEKLMNLETELNETRLPALLLEWKLQKGYLAYVRTAYEEAYNIFSEIVQEADNNRLYRQKSKALEAIDSLEKHGQQLTDSTRERTVYRYLEDARRILEEYS